MCGIFGSISRHGFVPAPNDALQSLQQRGPDSVLEIQRRVRIPGSTVSTCHLSLYASVLSLRGEGLAKQPLTDSATGQVLCWNGEAWTAQCAEITDNDTTVVFNLFKQAVGSATDPDGANIGIAKLLEGIRGPFAFLFYHEAGRKLYFARDCLGRRSLLTSSDAEGNFYIASVAARSISKSWSEVAADGLYVLDLDQQLEATFPSLHHIPYVFQEDFAGMPAMTLPFPRLNLEKPAQGDLALDLDSNAVRDFHARLRTSVQTRVSKIQRSQRCSAPVNVAILFSGGLDCSLLARLAHDLLPLGEPVDLLNVAFQNPRVHKSAAGSPYEQCPDRQTGRASLCELRRICPGRSFRLVCINVPYEETEAHRQLIIDLIHPHNTEMDFSIACALYFASRGQGTDSETNLPYVTPARVLISGLGADELFGGYQRHATAFDRGGYPDLLDELALDMSRLGKRNLGRDDRVISHWGREARYPYLDEHVVAWALKTPVWLKVGFGFASGSTLTPKDARISPILEPGKLLLRLLAWQLGMQGVAREKKRAIQFGARTAKMHSGRVKGTQLLAIT